MSAVKGLEKRVKTIPADYLPPKFDAQERYAHKWLNDCQIRGWMVDLLTKRVTWLDKYDRPHTFRTLVSFAEFYGMLTLSPDGEECLGVAGQIEE